MLLKYISLNFHLTRNIRGLKCVLSVSILPDMPTCLKVNLRYQYLRSNYRYDHRLAIIEVGNYSCEIPN